MAKTLTTSAIGPLLMKHLEPFRIYLSPFFTARLFMAAASDPAPGSVRPKATILSPEAMEGPYFFFCSSFPPIRIGFPAQRLHLDNQGRTDAGPGDFLNGQTYIDVAAMEPPVFLRNA